MTPKKESVWENGRKFYSNMRRTRTILIRTEHLTRPTQKPNRPEPTRYALDGSKNIRVGFRVLFSGYFRFWVGFGSVFGSYKYLSLNPILVFLKKKNPTFSSLQSPPPSALCLPPSLTSLFIPQRFKPHPYKPVSSYLLHLSLCKS